MPRGISTMSVTQKAEEVYSYTKGELEYISGKWFYRKQEVTEIERFLVHNWKRLFGNSRQIDEFIKMYVIMYGKSKMLWYPPKILEIAKNREVDRSKYDWLTNEQLMIINTLFTDNEIFWIVYGKGGTGKSTFLNLVKQLFESDVFSAPLSDLGNQFILAEAIKHRLIASDELGGHELNNAALKTIVSRQLVAANAKFQRPVNVQSQSRLIFATNKEPKIDLSDTGMIRRIRYYEMNKVIEKPNPEIAKQKFDEEVLCDILALALQTDMSNWEDKFRLQTRRILAKNNSVFLCWEIGREQDYNVYQTKCGSKGYKAYNEQNWQTLVELFEEWKDDLWKGNTVLCNTK